MTFTHSRFYLSKGMSLQDSQSWGDMDRACRSKTFVTKIVILGDNM